MPENAQWSDTIPKVPQEKIIQSFEASNYVRAVARPIEGLAADYQLLLDLRSFRIMGPSTAPAGDGRGAGSSSGGRERLLPGPGPRDNCARLAAGRPSVARAGR
jgi:hypothetical protein